MWRRTFVAARKFTGPFVPENAPSNKALVVGSSGTLGRTIVQQMRQHHKMKILGADVVPDDTGLSAFCDLSKCSNLPELTMTLSNAVKRFVRPEEKLDLVVCAAGGWAGNPPPAIVNTLPIEEQAREYAENMEHMRRVNLDPVIATGFLVPHFVVQNGLVVIMGATAATQPTPDMMAYGLFKSAVHFCVQTLGANTPLSLDPKSVRLRATSVHPVSVVGILPNVLDTPGNRQAMEYSPTWTPPREIAGQISEWMNTPALRPHSGALVRAQTNNKNETAFTVLR